MIRVFAHKQDGRSSFAFYNTVGDTFLSFNDVWAWDSWEEFVEDFDANSVGGDPQFYKPQFYKELLHRYFTQQAPLPEILQ